MSMDTLPEESPMVQNAIREIMAEVGDALTLNELQRHEMFNRILGRNSSTIDEDCGYEPTAQVTIDKLYHLWQRDPIARRCISLWPSECWKKYPKIYDIEPEKESEFEKAVEQLARDINGKSYADGDTVMSQLWSMLETAEELALIGNYGAIVLGFDDKRALKEPLEGFEEDPTIDQGLTSNEFKPPADRKLLYAQPFSQHHCKVTQWFNDKGHPKYGEPKMYEVRNDSSDTIETGVAIPLGSFEVHWSRVVHLCPHAKVSRIEADPQLLVTLNRLVDLKKEYGGAGEGFFQGALPGIKMEPAGNDVRFDDESYRQAKSALNEYVTRMKRFLASDSMKIGTIAPTVVSPEAHIAVAIEAICIVEGWPIRIFKGSERGELASSQDTDAFDGRVESRRMKVTTPRVVAPFFDRLIEVGTLPEPIEGGWKLAWPSLKEKTPTQKAELATIIVKVIGEYIKSGASEMISPLDFMTKLLGFEPDEAREILKAALAEAAEDAREEETQAKLDPPPTPPGLPATTLPPNPSTKAPTGGTSNQGPASGGAKTADGLRAKAKRLELAGNLGELGANAGNSLAGNNCGIGKGGFQSGNKCAKGGTGGGSTGTSKAGTKKAVDIQSIKKGDTVTHGSWGTGTVVKSSGPDTDGDWEIKAVYDKAGTKFTRGKPGDKIMKLEKEGDGFPNADDLKPTGKSIGGSTGAVQVKDSEGNLYVKKYGNSEEHLQNEYDTEQVYKAAGIKVSESKMYLDDDGKKFKLAKWEEGKPLSETTGKERELALKAIQKDIAIDATVANWDVIGMSEDNVLVRPNPDGAGVEVIRLDVAGSMSFRAQGGDKGQLWNADNNEVNTLRDNPKNPSATKVFGGMSDADVAASFERHSDKLEAIVKAAPPGEQAKLKARLENGYNKVKASNGPAPASQGAGAKELHSKIKADPAVGFSKSQQEKFEYLNPNGVHGDTVYIPLVGASPKDPKNAANAEAIKAALGPGIQVKAVYVPAKTLKEGAGKTFQGGDNIKPNSDVSKLLGDSSVFASGPGAGVSVGGSGFTAKVKGISLDGKSTSDSTPIQPKAKPKVAVPDWADKHPLSKTVSVGTVDPVTKIETGSKIKLGGKRSTKFSYLEKDDGDPPMTPKELQDLADKNAANATSGELSAVSFWKGGHSTDFRKRFASGDVQEIDADLASFLKKSPNFEGTLFRGVTSAPGYDPISPIIKAGVGGLWSEPTPRCTSRNSQTAVEFASGQLLIKVKAKTGAYVGRIGDFHGEDEVIGIPGSFYRITRIVKDAKIASGDQPGTFNPVQMYVEMEEI